MSDITKIVKTWDDYKIDMNEKLLYNEENKFEHFTDDELYILKCQAMVASWEICDCEAYSEYEVKLHEKLMNEIADEVKKREREVLNNY